MTMWILFILLGVLVGTLSGLFGIGGGVIMVPAIFYALKLIGFPEADAILIGTRTSLAIILFTSFSSTLGHNKKTPLRWDILKELMIFVIAGTILGTFIVHMIKPEVLKMILMIYIFLIGLKMWLGFKPKVHDGDHKPHLLLNTIVGGIIGLKSAVLGIGGGTISIPYLVWQNVSMGHAAGISAALGTMIALTGTATDLIRIEDLSIHNNMLGNIYLPALLGISSTSLYFARVGARYSHSLPQDKMRKGFALFLFLLSIRNITSHFMN